MFDVILAFRVFCESCKMDFEVTLCPKIRGKFSRKTYIFEKSMSFWGGNEYRIMYEKMWVNHPAKNLVPLKVLFKLDSLIGGNYHIFTVSSGY